MILAGGDGKQNILAKTGFAGYLCYGNEGSEDARRVAWGSRTVWLYKQLDMQGNKIYDVADPDPSETAGVVTVNYLNEALGSIETDTDTLDARYLKLSSSSVQKVTGAVEIASTSTTVNKFKVGNGTYTSFFIKGNGHAAYFRGSVYVNANEESGSTNHGGKRLATEEICRRQSMSRNAEARTQNRVNRKWSFIIKTTGSGPSLTNLTAKDINEPDATEGRPRHTVVSVTGQRNRLPVCRFLDHGLLRKIPTILFCLIGLVSELSFIHKGHRWEQNGSPRNTNDNLTITVGTWL